MSVRYALGREKKRADRFDDAVCHRTLHVLGRRIAPSVEIDTALFCAASRIARPMMRSSAS